MWSISLGSRNLWIWAREEVIRLGDYGLDDSVVLGLFFFKSGTWLYVALLFSVLAGSDFGLLGQEMWEFDAAVSLGERDHCKERI